MLRHDFIFQKRKRMGLTIHDELVNTRTGLSSVNSYGCFPEPPRWTKYMHPEIQTTTTTDEKTGATLTTTTTTTTLKYGMTAQLKCFAAGKTWRDRLEPVYTLHLNKTVDPVEVTGDIWALAYAEAKAQLTALGKSFTDDIQ